MQKVSEFIAQNVSRVVRNRMASICYIYVLRLSQLTTDKFKHLMYELHTFSHWQVYT